MFSSFNRKNPIVLIMTMVLFYGLQNVCFAQAVVDAGNDDSKHKHDGFYLRLTTGSGATAAAEDYDGDLLTISGISSNATIGIGYAIRENFIVNLDILASVMMEAEYEINDEVIDADAEFTLSNLGLGLTYYIMPSNVYLSGSLGLAIGEIETDYASFDTDLGYGLKIAVGKEWWVSDNWGIGIAIHSFYSRLPDIDDFIEEDNYLHTLSFGLLFSATFN